jgi:hypothetical protein
MTTKVDLGECAWIEMMASMENECVAELGKQEAG